MRAHDRVLLLAEIFGANVTPHINQVLQNIENSQSYQTLLDNVERAKLYSVPYTEEFLKSYDEMKFASIATLRDALIAKATIDHLSTISSPRYFINPITYNHMEMKSDIKYVEQLPCYVKGKEESIESMLANAGIGVKAKMKIIRDLTEKWHSDAKEVVIDEINTLMNEKEKEFKQRNRITRDTRALIYLLTACNIFLIASLLSQNLVFVMMRSFDKPYTSVVAYLVFVLVLVAFEVQFLASYFISRHRFSERTQCYKYLRNHGRHAVGQLKLASFKLRMELLDTLKEKKAKNTLLEKFNYLSNYRRILIFLKMAEPKAKPRKKTNYFAALSIGVMILVFVIILIITLINLASGGLI